MKRLIGLIFRAFLSVTGKSNRDNTPVVIKVVYVPVFVKKPGKPDISMSREELNKSTREYVLGVFGVN